MPASLWKKPNFFSLACLSRPTGNDGLGYFAHAARVAYVSRIPPGRADCGGRVRDRRREPSAFPSKLVKSAFCSLERPERTRSPFLLRKKPEMASSPEWPKGGLPRS